jgi:sulfoxide reductase heme-binding subunit YedZ
MSSVVPPAAPPVAPIASVSARRKPLLLHPAAKVLLFVAALLPLAWYVWGAVANTLGANPAEALIRGMGDWTLRFLCLTLAVTPVRQWTNTPALARFRRMLGLFAFFYGCLHFLCYAWLDKDLLLSDILPDIAKRPFILVGTLSLLLMLPLAATSFNRAIKALGAPRWQRLHRLVYATVLLALLHFFWMRAGKNNFAEVGVYASIVAVLLGWRVVTALRRRSASRVTP